MSELYNLLSDNKYLTIAFGAYMIVSAFVLTKLIQTRPTSSQNDYDKNAEKREKKWEEQEKQLEEQRKQWEEQEKQWEEQQKQLEEQRKQWEEQRKQWDENAESARKLLVASKNDSQIHEILDAKVFFGREPESPDHVRDLLFKAKQLWGDYYSSEKNEDTRQLCCARKLQRLIGVEMYLLGTENVGREDFIRR